MRKVILSLFLLLIICTGECSASELDESKGMKKSTVDVSKVSNDVIVTIKEKKISVTYPSYITLSYNNNSDKTYYYSYGAYLEKKINNEWYEVTSSVEHQFKQPRYSLWDYSSPAYYLRSHSMREEVFSLGAYENLNTGEYRIVKRMDEGTNQEYLTSDINADIAVRDDSIIPIPSVGEIVIFGEFVVDEGMEKSAVDVSKVSSDVTMTIKEKKISKPYPKYITLSYNNNSDKEYHYGEAARLEKKIINKWYEMPQSEVYAVNKVSYSLPGNSTGMRDELFYLEGYLDNLDTGEYRIVKRMDKGLDLEYVIDVIKAVLSGGEDFVLPKLGEIFIFAEFMVEEGIKKSTVDMLTVSSKVILTIEEEKISEPYPKYIMLTYNNNSDREHVYGAGVHLEKKINNEWYEVPLQEGYAFNSAGYSLPGYSMKEESFYFAGYLENLSPGEYRIVKRMKEYLGSILKYSYSESEIEYLLSIGESPLHPYFLHEHCYEEIIIFDGFTIE